MKQESRVLYPAGLLDWAGHRGGGVRRLFDPSSGRPGEAVFETNLLSRLRDWAQRIAAAEQGTPRVVLLVGGPGNGKTEAVEATIGDLDVALNCRGALVEELAKSYHPPQGKAVPRLVAVDAGAASQPVRDLRIEVVQDASVGGQGNHTPAMLLVQELEAALRSPTGVYICCVNRGVLDDALIYSIDSGLSSSQDLLEAVVRAVSLAPDAPSCWPLEEYPVIAAWPMDAESLVEPTDSREDAPAAAVLGRALDPARWREGGVCQAGSACPFCGSRKLLAGRRETESFLRMLRWFELGTSKRWAFRDLFSLTSYLLAGNGTGHRGASVDPCEWASSLVESDKQAQLQGRPKKDTSAALFWLVSVQYQHALFHRWERGLASSLLQDIRELGLQEDNTAMGLHYFLQSRITGYVPATIAASLDAFVELLDPAMSSPDAEVILWGGAVRLGEFDARFSRSVREGLDFAVGCRALSHNERTLLERLAALDELLAVPRLRLKRPAAANRIQRAVRDFACRITRRSVGARNAAVPDAATLDAFKRVVADADGEGHDLREIANQVEDLLNDDHNFNVSLTTTFGQPLPPSRRRATLVVSRRRVFPRDVAHKGRPRQSICFLDVEVGSTPQPIALTYDLFKAVTDLDHGLSPASLPRSVLALLDTTRARMAGSMVRDRDVRERPTIILGETVAVERYRGRFEAGKRGGRR
ncbi:zeta toxin family protein [Bradyrhizobium sp. 21]|uniref:zeta toxin family protein n=1 Tax=Bradyrhizobium sp. 21 TaxID=2782666 RepID=UPI001FF9DB9F